MRRGIYDRGGTIGLLHWVGVWTGLVLDHIWEWE